MLARSLLRELDGAGDAPSQIPIAVRRRLFAALMAIYSREGDGPPYEPGASSTDEVAVTAAAMLRAADITTFELAALFNV